MFFSFVDKGQQGKGWETHVVSQRGSLIQGVSSQKVMWPNRSGPSTERFLQRHPQPLPSKTQEANPRLLVHERFGRLSCMQAGQATSGA